MGIPGFYRYVSTRYRGVCEAVKAGQVSDFDNFYLDCNGIIHICCTGSSGESLESCLEVIFERIFLYIDVLFKLIRPKKLFFLAVDGVAPQAKINQQRCRRFRSSKEHEMNRNKLLAKGITLPNFIFDKNCITPGTVFMMHLHEHLKYFISQKISTDPLWQKCKVIYSGHQTPGEGEHKIMDYIRFLRAQCNFDPNTKHCIYGADADLMLLGLSTHEPYFTVLRERPLYGKDKDKVIVPDQSDIFIFIHLSLLRDYLDLEFRDLKDKISFEYNIDSVIDDWIFLTFLFGNDFLPALPQLHIHKNAVSILQNVYKEIMPNMDGYLNVNGYLNLPRFQKFIEKLSEFDLNEFKETFADLKYLESKTIDAGEKPNVDVEVDFLLDTSKQPVVNVKKNKELEELIKLTDDLFLSDDESVPSDDDTFYLEFCRNKKHYYSDKMGIEKVTDEVLKEQTRTYIHGLQWNLHYYYRGCQSWSWYYPFYYAPFISDLTDFRDMKIEMELGKPFLPFQQLLAVLPPSSSKLVPKPYQDLMTSSDSPIIDFYPEEFETDLNSKRYEWEALILLPFINKLRLLDAMKPLDELLNVEEQKRNCHLPAHQFTYTNKDLGVYKMSRFFPSISKNHASMVDIHDNEIKVPSSSLKYGLRPGVSFDTVFKGFPKLRFLPFTSSLIQLRNQKMGDLITTEIMFLKLTERDFPSFDQLKKKLLGKIVFSNWPYLIESKVVALTDTTTINEQNKPSMESQELGQQILSTVTSVEKQYLDKLKIDIGKTSTVAFVKHLEGEKMIKTSDGKITVLKVWSNNPSPCPLQTIVQDIQAYESLKKREDSLDYLFPVGSVVFSLDLPYLGAKGRVLDSTNCIKQNLIRVAFEVVNDPYINLQEITAAASKANYYMTAREAAAALGIQPLVLSRITGKIFISTEGCKELRSEQGRYFNIGLTIKFNSINEELPGYTKYLYNHWKYSKKAVDIVAEYIRKFPKVVEVISSHQETLMLTVQDVAPNPEDIVDLKELISWLDHLEYKKILSVPCGSKVLEEEVVAEIEKIVDNFRKKTEIRTLTVSPISLYKEDFVIGNVCPVECDKHNLMDRIVSVKSCLVPTGLRGYIIGIEKALKKEDFKYHILFDEPFLGGSETSSSKKKVYIMLENFFINKSAGIKEQQNQKQNYSMQINEQIFPEKKKSTTDVSAAGNNDQFKELWSNLMTEKPEEKTNALKKLLKIEEKESQVQDPVKMFFEKVTASSLAPQKPGKKIFNSSSTSNKMTTQRPNYYQKLFSYYQKQKLGLPKFDYIYCADKIIAQLYMPNGKIYTGLPCDTKESACESASLQVFGDLKLNEKEIKNLSLHQHNSFDKKKKILKRNEGLHQNQPSQLSSSNQHSSQFHGHSRNQGYIREKLNNQNLSSSKNKYYKFNTTFEAPGRDTGNFSDPALMANVPEMLPYPPQNWMVPKKKPVQAADPEEKLQESQSRPSNKLQSGMSSAVGFVPLQAITGKRVFRPLLTIKPNSQVSSTAEKIQSGNPAPNSKQVNVVNNDKVIKPEESSTSAGPPRRRTKIAANLNLNPNLF